MSQSTISMAPAAPVGGLITSVEAVPPQLVVGGVADIFLRNESVDAIAVVDGAEPVGIVTRAKLMFTLFRRFGFELFGRDPIISIADTAPLCVNEREHLDVAIDLVLARPPQNIYDDIIVVDDAGRFAGLLSVKQLVVQQGNALASTMLQRELASERARELEKINTVKSRFLAHVTHELRSPVNVIIGLAELMRVEIDKGNLDQLSRRLSLMLTSAENLRAVVTNILDLSKIEAGKMDVLPERFDAADLLRETAEAARVLLGSKPVDVVFSVDPDPLWMWSDPVKVKQIAVNLAGNAAKFTMTGAIRIAAEQRGGHAVITISDTGIGIRREDFDRLFSAFGQIEDAATKQYAGTGLGLVITKHLTELLGGSVTLASEFGKGTTFTVVLPLRVDSSERPATA